MCCVRQKPRPTEAQTGGNFDIQLVPGYAARREILLLRAPPRLGRRWRDHRSSQIGWAKYNEEGNQKTKDFEGDKVYDKRFLGDEVPLSEAVLSHGFKFDVLLLSLGELELVGVEADCVCNSHIDQKSHRKYQIRCADCISVLAR